MATYTYLFVDMLTGGVLAELPCFGTYFERRLGEAGNMNASVLLDMEGIPNDLVLDATIPGRTALYVDRDGALVWGGPIWSRTYQSQSKSLQMTGQTWESYLARIVADFTVVYNDDQRNIIRDLWYRTTTDVQLNVQIQLPGTFAADVVRTYNVNSYDFQYYHDIIDSILKQDNSCDYTIDVGYADGYPRPFLALGWPRIGQPLETSGLVFDYPGAITNYWWPESASDGLIKAYALGAGEGPARVFGTHTHTDLLAGGYPRLQRTFSHQDVTAQATIDNHAMYDADLYRIPLTVPTFELRADLDPIFGSYGLGDDARFVFDRDVDPRWPDGLDATFRVTGWNLRPPEASGTEQVTLVIAGADSATL